MVYIWIDSSWTKDQNGKPIVVLFGRDPVTLKTKIIGVKDFIPHFWVHNDDYNEVHGTKYIEERISCFGEPIRRIDVSTPDRMSVERSLYNRTYEGDVPFDIRYTVDNRINYAFDSNGKSVQYDGSFNQRIGYYDIEVRAPQEIMPRHEKPRFPIVCISLYDSYTDDVYVYTLGGYDVDLSGMQEKLSKKSNCNLHLIHIPFNNERKMITAFANKVKEIDFDIMTAWNGAGFDDPYIVNRSDVISANIQGLSRLSRSNVTNRRWVGRILIDQMKMFMTWSKPMGKMPFGLKSVAKSFSNFEYENQGSNIDKMMTDGRWNEIIEYSACDVIAQKLIDRDTNLFGFYENVRKVMGVKLNDVLSSSIMIETLLMKRGMKPMPTRTFVNDGESVEGALVLKPIPGVHSNVGVFDAKALYPSIIIMHNLSPDIDGMIPKVIIEMMEEREKLRAIRMAGNADDNMKNAETATKYIVNSFYGYMLFKAARLYNKEIGAKITGEGRTIIRAVGGEVEKMGYTVSYGDTDSTFVKGIMSPEQGMEIEVKINKFLVEWSTKNDIDELFAPTVKFEKLYGRIMFKMKAGVGKKKKKLEAAKKRYAGHLVWKDGFEVDKMDFVGLETRRSDAAIVTKDTMILFFEYILKDNDIEKANKLVKKAYNDVKSGSIEIQNVGLPRGIKSDKVNVWTKGMDNATIMWKIRWDEQPRPKLLYCLRPYKQICVDDDMTEIPLNDKGKLSIVIDWNIMADKTIRNKFESLLMSIGVDWDKVVNGQSSLFDF